MEYTDLPFENLRKLSYRFVISKFAARDFIRCSIRLILRSSAESESESNTKLRQHDRVAVLVSIWFA